MPSYLSCLRNDSPSSDFALLSSTARPTVKGQSAFLFERRFIGIAIIQRPDFRGLMKHRRETNETCVSYLVQQSIILYIASTLGVYVSRYSESV